MPLKIADIFAIFQREGTCPSVIDLLQSSASGLIRELPNVFKSFGDTSSGPLGFETFKACIWSFISCSVIVICSREKFGRVFAGREGGFSIFEILAKCLFNVLALSRGCVS